MPSTELQEMEFLGAGGRFLQEEICCGRTSKHVSLLLHNHSEVLLDCSIENYLLCDYILSCFTVKPS